jgi:phage tail sheath protein FI
VETAAARPAISAPRLDVDGYRAWAGAIRYVLDMLRTPSGAAHRRDVQLIAAWPLPVHDADLAGVEAWPLTLFQRSGFPEAGQAIDSADWIGSALLQLAYPWVQTSGSAALPEGIETPEGALAGMIARGSLLNGTSRSIAGQVLASVTDTVPTLARGDMLRGLPDGRADWLGDRFCLIGPRSDGLVVLSDATMSVDPVWRAGSVSRLMGVILRAARWLGQDLIFEASGEAFWTRIRRSIEAFLTELWSLGALDGASPADAFDVRCDRTTMTQNDIDAGRVIVRITVTAAQPIERITVTLTLTDAGGLAEAA